MSNRKLGNRFVVGVSQGTDTVSFEFPSSTTKQISISVGDDEVTLTPAELMAMLRGALTVIRSKRGSK